MANNVNTNIINDIKLILTILIFLFDEKIFYMSQINYLFNDKIFIYILIISFTDLLVYVRASILQGQLINCASI